MIVNTQFETLFYFMNENIQIVEVKRTDIDESSDKSLLYHWLVLAAGCDKAEKLHFVSMGKEDVKGIEINVRTFEEGELRFDENWAKFLYNGEGHIVVKENADIVPENLKSIIASYLRSLTD